MKGKGLIVTHYYKDTLWKYGSKEDPPVLNNLPGENDSDEEGEETEEGTGGDKTGAGKDKGKKPEPPASSGRFSLSFLNFLSFCLSVFFFHPPYLFAHPQ
jgi:hypothetical protein